MTIVVGYIPRPEGLAAVDSAITEAERRGESLVVVNTGHHGDYADPSFAASQDLEALDAQLTARGIDHEIRQPTRGLAPADELLDAAAEVGRHAHRHRPAPAQPARQAHHRLHRAAGAARRVVRRARRQGAA